jgi:hypothetical protein
VFVFAGSMTMMSTELPGRPVVMGFQLPPPSVLLKTLPSSGVVFEVAA